MLLYIAMELTKTTPSIATAPGNLQRLILCFLYLRRRLWYSYSKLRSDPSSPPIAADSIKQPSYALIIWRPKILICEYYRILLSKCRQNPSQQIAPISSATKLPMISCMIRAQNELIKAWLTGKVCGPFHEVGKPANEQFKITKCCFVAVF